MNLLHVYFFPPEYPSWLGKGFLRRPFRLLSRTTNYRRNPRDDRYMRRLAAEVFGDEGQGTQGGSLRRESVRNSREIVLLWPDGNGYGWFWVELRVFLWKGKGSKVTVLNGRRRYFELTYRLWLAYGARRLLERYWVGEVAFTAIFLAVSPIMVAWDLLRGRR